MTRRCRVALTHALCGVLSAIALSAVAQPARPPEEPAARVAPAAAKREAAAAAIDTTASGKISLRFQEIALSEVFDLLSRHARTNILLGKGVGGTVSLNLYDVGIREAVHAVAQAAGYTVEMRGGAYLVLGRDDTGQDAAGAATRVRTFKVQYSNPKQVAEILAKYLSRQGKITALAERNMLVVEDAPDFLERVQRLLEEIDVEPRQILIEAKILEITLDRNETFGVDWTKVFSADGRNKVGTTGLAPRGGAGLFFNLVNHNLEVFLSALSSKGRVHTLSTPKLLALENQEASAVIGENVGYKVTTTINQVTTESIQFLETGVILKVTPSVDQRGRVMMRIHPEVSSASVTGGIPSKKSTEVTTQLVCEDGQAIFIGGLIKRTSGSRKAGVPVLGELPAVGALFSTTEETGSTTETVVIITPRIVTRAQQTLEGVDTGAAAALQGAAGSQREATPMNAAGAALPRGAPPPQ